MESFIAMAADGTKLSIAIRRSRVEVVTREGTLGAPGLTRLVGPPGTIVRHIAKGVYEVEEKREPYRTYRVTSTDPAAP